MLLTKAQIRVFLKKHNLKANELAQMADVWRWSLKRFLEQPTASITLRIANKLEDAMQAYEREPYH